MQYPDARWVLAEVSSEAGEERIPALARRLGVPTLVSRLLWLRDLRTVEEARAFLNPRLADLRPPDDLPDVARAAERLARAVRQGERVAVFGDYDVDGMTGTALLVRFLDLAGGDAIWEIPDREGDGYGLGRGAVDRLADLGARVIVTVDNGIAAHDAVAHAAARGIDVVITDHHLPHDTLPAAHSVVNPHRADAGDAGRDLCGCALAFKTAWAVADRLRAWAGEEGTEAFRDFLRDALGLVALATVSDVMPLRGENRLLVAAGLTAIRSSSHSGIRALLESARLGAAPLTADDVAFRLAPRLNAAGRLSCPDLVVDLLRARDEETARHRARALADANGRRRRLEKDVLAEARRQASEQVGEQSPASLVVHGEGWHRGVIGIVAARLADQHHRPVVVIGFDGEEGRGSCRAPDAVNLHRALGRCRPLLRRFGGHAAAAGLEIERGCVDRFATAFEDAVREQVGPALPPRTLRIDAECAVDDWDLETAEAVLRLDPFGPANPVPLFLIRGARVAGRTRLLGRDATHLSFALRQSAGAVRVVGFRRADLHDVAADGTPLDLVVTPMLNEWNGRRTVELRLVDLRPHDPARVVEREPYPAGPAGPS